jgi:hypothetical protein
MRSTFKNKTSLFGSDAESYVARLFLMSNNPNGTQRPDLTSTHRRYTPKLSLEVKSGRQQKGILVDYQLQYAVTASYDYVSAFMREFPENEGLIPNEIWKDRLKEIQSEPIAYYYNLINRVDEVKASDLKSRQHTIQLQWGNQYIVPHKFGFYAFAIGRIMRTGEDPEFVVSQLEEMIVSDSQDNDIDYGRKGHKQSWQNIQGRDILAIFEKNEDIATKDGKKRIELFHRLYPEIEDLKRIIIPGPNSTTLYILAEPSHEDLFDDQVRLVIDETTPDVEALILEREQAFPLLTKPDLTRQNHLDLLSKWGMVNDQVLM